MVECYLHCVEEEYEMNLILSDISLNIPEDILSEDTCYIDLTQKKISNCIGCFSCWTKTPSKCVIRDDATLIYPKIAKSENLMYISKVKYGSYELPMKVMLERAIPIQQAFIRLYHKEAHHVQRDVALKQATIIAYGDISDEEKLIFKSLVDRNTHNMNFKSHEVVFTYECDLLESVKSEVLKWKK